MDAPTIIVALIVIAAVGFIIYKVTRNSGSSTTGFTAPGKPNPFDTDLR